MSLSWDPSLHLQKPIFQNSHIHRSQGKDRTYLFFQGGGETTQPITLGFKLITVLPHTEFSHHIVMLFPAFSLVCFLNKGQEKSFHVATTTV
jgi:hypothetical protein